MQESRKGANVEADATQPKDPTADQIGSADLVVGILAESDSNAIAKMCDALRTLPGPLRIAVLHEGQQPSPAPANPETAPERAQVSS